MFLILVVLSRLGLIRGVTFRTRVSAGGTFCMMLYHGGVGTDFLPRMLWLSSSVTVWKTLAGRICLPPMAKSEVLVSTDQMRGLVGE